MRSPSGELSPFAELPVTWKTTGDGSSGATHSKLQLATSYRGRVANGGNRPPGARHDHPGNHAGKEPPLRNTHFTHFT